MAKITRPSSTTVGMMRFRASKPFDRVLIGGGARKRLLKGVIHGLKKPKKMGGSERALWTDASSPTAPGKGVFKRRKLRNRKRKK